MKVTDELPVRAILILISVALWEAFTFVNATMFDFAMEAPGVHAIYLPAGVRLLILLLFGVWGAIGIAIVHPFAILAQTGASDVTYLIIDSVISGFGGLLVLVAAKKFFGISRNLEGLRAKHLPLLSLMMAIAMPLMFNITQVLFSYRSVSEAAKSYLTMLLGDFLGCFIVIAAVLLLIRAYRILAQVRTGSGME